MLPLTQYCEQSICMLYNSNDVYNEEYLHISFYIFPLFVT